jgi:hypothetical protein
MSAISIDAGFTFGFQFRIGRDDAEPEVGTGRPGEPSAHAKAAAGAVAEPEPQRRWLRYVWPFVSLAAATALRVLRLHGLG